MPKYLQGVLSQELYQQQLQTREGKTKEPLQKFAGSLFSEIDKLADQGYLGPTGKDPKNKSVIVDQDVYMQNWVRAEDTKAHMRNWLNEKPNATTAEAHDELRNFSGGPAADQAVREMRARGESLEAFRSAVPDQPGTRRGERLPGGGLRPLERRPIPEGPGTSAAGPAAHRAGT